MTPRIFCILAALSLAPIVTALVFHAAGAFKSLMFEAASSGGMGVYSAEFGHSHLELNLISFNRDGKAKLHSFHVRY